MPQAVLSSPARSPKAPAPPQTGFGLLSRAAWDADPGTAQRRRVAPTGDDELRSAFVEEQAALPVAALLAHTELGGYAAAFESAEIDSELAADLSVSELHSVLGAGAPLGHALKLRRVFADAARIVRQPRPRIPAAPAWQVLSRISAVGQCDGKLASSFMLLQELNVIAASLYMSLCLPVMLDLPTECADGSACDALRAVNAVLWAIATASFVTSTGGAWIMLIVVQAVSDTHQAKWQEDHIRQSSLPAGLFVLGVTVTPVAVCSQLLIGSLGGPSYSPAIRWAVVAIVMVVGWALERFFFILAPTRFPLFSKARPAFFNPFSKAAMSLEVVFLPINGILKYVENNFI
eukprot:SAG22_NODE_1731_length_3703_cov_2.829634_1_plen_347_part_10